MLHMEPLYVPYFLVPSPSITSFQATVHLIGARHNRQLYWISLLRGHWIEKDVEWSSGAQIEVLFRHLPRQNKEKAAQKLQSV
jgi:hypothetical protein